MKTEFKAKFLNHLTQRKQGDKGFTLIELLVVIIIIGILAAIALPAFLNQANKAKQSEARTNAGSLNRAQQAYFLEKNEFVTDSANFAKLGLGIPTQTSNYKYTIAGKAGAQAIASNQAQPIVASAPIKAYVGGVQIGTVGTPAVKETSTLAILCEANDPPATGGPSGAQDATYDPALNATPKCPANYTAIK
jgi:type IV pilus assembly protein PilA